MKSWLENSRRKELTAAGVLSLAMAGLILIVQILASPQIRNSPVQSQLEPVVVFPDFASIQSVQVKKQQFFDYLQDYIVAENQRIAVLRDELEPYLDIANSGVAFSSRERDWVLELAQIYRIESGQYNDREIVTELMQRVDEIPVSLVLAQAANESAWGTSRFTLEGNNIFGQWCYVEGCGIVPSRRVSGASHEVKRFDSVQGSVEAYFNNINSHPSYDYFRELRSQMRRRQRQLDPMVLAYGLGRYSERGDNYVDEVQNIIIQNELRDRDKS